MCTSWRGNSLVVIYIGACVLKIHELALAFSVLLAKYICILFASVVLITWHCVEDVCNIRICKGFELKTILSKSQQELNNVYW